MWFTNGDFHETISDGAIDRNYPDSKEFLAPADVSATNKLPVQPAKTGRTNFMFILPEE